MRRTIETQGGLGATTTLYDRLARDARVHAIVIAGLALLAYANSFGAPFVFDDLYYIVKNPVIRDWALLLHPAPSDRGAFNELIERSISTRYMGHVSFALNYALNGLDAWGYHFVNVLIHAANSLLVYALVRGAFGAPSLARRAAGMAAPAALIAALVFALHPAQTQAVTYLSQRFASLVAFFYLSTVVSYAAARRSGGREAAVALYAVSVLCAVLAAKTKETAFTLPFALVLYEIVFFEGRLLARALLLAPFFLAAALIPMALIKGGLPLADAMDRATRTQDVISRAEYMATQPKVVTRYMVLFLFPINQNLDYDVLLARGLTDRAALGPLAAIAAIMGAAAYLCARYRRSEPAIVLVAFGVGWFFLTLGVESGAVALGDVIFEHRMYLPMAGAGAALGAGAAVASARMPGARAAVCAGVALMLALFLIATVARNHVWRSEVSLWEDAAAKSPLRARVRYALGGALNDEGRYQEAVREFRAALSILPEYAQAHNGLGIAYDRLGERERALIEYQLSISADPQYADAYGNLASLYGRTGRNSLAASILEDAVRRFQGRADLHYDLGLAYSRMGRSEDAAESLDRAVELSPEDFKARAALEAVLK